MMEEIMFYCCEDMRIAIEKWGGVWWDEAGKSWFIEEDYGDESRAHKITNCPWCETELPQKDEER